LVFPSNILRICAAEREGGRRRRDALQVASVMEPRHRLGVLTALEEQASFDVRRHQQ